MSLFSLVICHKQHNQLPTQNVPGKCDDARNETDTMCKHIIVRIPCPSEEVRTFHLYLAFFLAACFKISLVLFMYAWAVYVKILIFMIVHTYAMLDHYVRRFFRALIVRNLSTVCTEWHPPQEFIFFH